MVQWQRNSSKRSNDVGKYDKTVPFLLASFINMMLSYTLHFFTCPYFYVCHHFIKVCCCFDQRRNSLYIIYACRFLFTCFGVFLGFFLSMMYDENPRWSQPDFLPGVNSAPRHLTSPCSVHIIENLYALHPLSNTSPPDSAKQRSTLYSPILMSAG